MSDSRLAALSSWTQTSPASTQLSSPRSSIGGPMYNLDRLRTEAFRAALAEAGRDVPALAGFKRAAPLTFTYASCEVDSYGFALLDVTATANGWALIEQNGSN